MTTHSTTHGISPSFGTVIRMRLRAAESRSRPARVRMITRATFLLTNVTFLLIASRERRETNKRTIHAGSVERYQHFDRTCGLHLRGSVFFPEDRASRFLRNVSSYPAALHNIPEDHRLHILSILNFTSHTMCICVSWSLSVAQTTDRRHH